uniref:Uncharacterized protein n=1 Tax=Parascaris univalens TaxID=6257 RepID=A0A915AFB4_PARUN
MVSKEHRQNNKCNIDEFIVTTCSRGNQLLHVAEEKQNHYDERLNIEICSDEAHWKRYLLLPVTSYCHSGQQVTDVSNVAITTILFPIFGSLGSPKILPS